MANLLGIFGRRAAAAVEPAASPSSSAPVSSGPSDAAPESRDDLSPVLDFLGTLLQCWSKHPILLPNEDSALAERTIAEWQRHATLGSPIPGVHAPDQLAGPVHARDWTALTALTSARRRAEAVNVGENLGDLQRAVWATVSSLARVAGDDATSDAAVETQLTLLRACAQRADAAATMRELPAALQAITEAMAVRQTSAMRDRIAMAERVESLGRALSASEDAARTDPMTGAGNRLRFVETMQRSLALMTLSGAPASLLAIDVDELKRINDTLGHAAGDIAINSVAKACWTVCTRPSDVLCRLGGDEFAVVMTHTDVTAAASLADRLERRMQEVQVKLSDDVSRPVTASIGFAAAKPGESVDSWIARADKSLYDVKHSRKATTTAAT